MSETPLTYSLDRSTAVITLDDGKANALSEVMIADFLAALTRAEAEAAAVVVAGRPERFCAGFDLKVMTRSAASATELLRVGCDLYLRLFTSPLPVVMACTGHALAGGALLLLTGDVRIGAAGNYRLGLNEVAIGMPVPVLGLELARARLAPTELTRATLGAHIYDPAGAAAAGYLDEVVPLEQVVGRAKAEAARLGALPRSAYHGTKLRLRRGTAEEIRRSLESDLSQLTAILPQ